MIGPSTASRHGVFAPSGSRGVCATIERPEPNTLRLASALKASKDIKAGRVVENTGTPELGVTALNQGNVSNLLSVSIVLFSTLRPVLFV
jgi:hypothetical protein